MELSLFEERRKEEYPRRIGRKRASFHATPSNHTAITYRLSIHIFRIFSLHEYSQNFTLGSRDATFHCREKFTIDYTRSYRARKKEKKKERVTKLICGLENSHNCKYQFFPPLFKSRFREISDYRLIHNIEWFSFLFPLLFGLIFHIPHPVNQLG